MMKSLRLGRRLLRGLGPTTADLADVQKRWKALLKDATNGLDLGQTMKGGMGQKARTAPAGRETSAAGFRVTRAFGANPGGLRMLSVVPGGLPAGAPLVVVLHGCTQDARDYDHGSGWSDLARAGDFAVLYPEQQKANNANACFSWFQTPDIRRGEGEVESIREMIVHMIATHRLDPRRVYLTGLSAGAAMGAAVLACYPELIRAGALFGGLPYGSAEGVAEAFAAMGSGRAREARAWGDIVRNAAPPPPAWPAVSVWHGTADRTVSAVNAEALVEQWRDVHGLPRRPSDTLREGSLRRRRWTGTDGRPLVEEVLVEGMDHGVPVERPGGTSAAPYFLDVGVSSTRLLAQDWGLLPATAKAG